MRAFLHALTSETHERLLAALHRHGYTVDGDPSALLPDALDGAALVAVEAEGPGGAALLRRLRAAIDAGSGPHPSLLAVTDADADADAAREAGADGVARWGDALDAWLAAYRRREVRHEHEHFRRLAEGLPQLVWTCTADGACDYLSPQWLDYTGVPEEDQLGFGWFDAVHPDDRDATRVAWEAAIENGQAFRFEFRLRRHDGAYRWFDTRATQLAFGDAERRWFGANTEIHDLKEAEGALREQAALTHAVLDTAVDAIITIDEGGLIASMNPSAERLFGYAAAEMEGRNVSVLMPEPYHSAHDDYLRAYLTTGVRKIIGIGRTVTGLRKDGTVFPMELAVSEVRLADRRLFAGFVRDLSERRRLEREVVAVAEDERRRIGRELHDGLGSHLSGLSMLCQGLTRRVEQGGAVAAAELGDVARLAQEGARQARTLSHELAPAVLDEQGLGRALEALAATAATVSGLPVRFDGPSGGYTDEGALPALPEGTTLHLYRIAQEAVNNALKHAGPSRINVSLSVEDDALTLNIRDDGRGFAVPPAAGAPPSDGLGLHVMRYRADTIGATFSIREGPGGGTAITCRLPLPPTP